MEIKKGYRYVCIKSTNGLTKGEVYTTNTVGKHIVNKFGSYSPITHQNYEEYFIPYSQLDRVYTKHTPLLESIFNKYDGKKVKDSRDIRWYCNCDARDITGYLWADASGGDYSTEDYYQDNNYIYLSEKAFIEFMDLGKYIGSLNTESEEEVVEFPTKWYLDTEKDGVDKEVVIEYLKSTGSFINFSHVQELLLSEDVQNDGSFQYWGGDAGHVEKHGFVEISYEDFLRYVVGEKDNELREDTQESERILPQANDFKDITDSIADLLQYKNTKYGNSALEPLKIFSDKCKVGTRIDDKLARIKNSDSLKKNDVADLIGYCVLICKENGWNNFDEFKD